MLLDMVWERVSINSSTKKLLSMIGDSLLIATNVGLAGAIVCVIVILSLDQRFYLRSGSVELEPLFVDGLRYTVRCDSRVM